jgi:hypothetical protein
MIYPAIVYKKRDKLVLSGYVESSVPTKTNPNKLPDYVFQAAHENKWCVHWLEVPQGDGDTIAEAIHNRVAIVVSDGSFRQEYRAAAFVLEGDSSELCLTGHVLLPQEEAMTILCIAVN